MYTMKYTDPDQSRKLQSLKALIGEMMAVAPLCVRRDQELGVDLVANLDPGMYSVLPYQV